MKKLLLIILCLPIIGFGQNLPPSVVMINITGGTFTMGNNTAPQMFDDQDPEHLVTIDNFQMSETEISIDISFNSNLLLSNGIFLPDLSRNFDKYLRGKLYHGKQ